MRNAGELVRELITKPLGAEKLAEILDSLACIPLYYDRPDLLPDALGWTSEAIRHAPAAITLKGTRAGILIELGRIDEGEALLREVLKRSECPLDHAISSAYFAKTHILRGEYEAAQRWLQKALKLAPKQKVVQRIEQELESLTDLRIPIP